MTDIKENTNITKKESNYDKQMLKIKALELVQPKIRYTLTGFKYKCNCTICLYHCYDD